MISVNVRNKVCYKTDLHECSVYQCDKKGNYTAAETVSRLNVKVGVPHRDSVLGEKKVNRNPNLDIYQ